MPPRSIFFVHFTKTQWFISFIWLLGGAILSINLEWYLGVHLMHTGTLHGLSLIEIKILYSNAIISSCYTK